MLFMDKLELEKTRALIAKAGGASKIAKKLNITTQAISQWSRVPAERVIPIEQISGGAVSRHELRPDIYPDSSAA